MRWPKTLCILHSITYRIATGPYAGRKVFTLQTLPGSNELFDDRAGNVAGFSFHAGEAGQRQPGQGG